MINLKKWDCKGPRPFAGWRAEPSLNFKFFSDKNRPRLELNQRPVA